MVKSVRTYRLKISSRKIYSEICQSSASVWNECLSLMSIYQYERGYPHAHNDFWFDNSCEGWMDKQLTKSQSLHSQSIQAVRKRYFESWQSFFALRKSGNIENARPPRRKRKYMTTRWLKSAIKFKRHKLSGEYIVVLSRGNGEFPLDIPLPDSFDTSKINSIATIDLCYKYGKWELHFTYNLESDDIEVGENIIGVDIGEIHPMVSHDGENTEIFNGRYIRSLYRLRNKVLSGYQSVTDICKRHSKRWWYLVRRKWKRIKKIDNQIKDALHKHTTKFVNLCQERNIGIIILGDLTGIRENINYGKRANQKLHQWSFAKITDMITYKAKSIGIKVIKISEAYTSQTCPQCGHRKKPTNRNYHCSKCDFKYHRDGVGAINIRKKYLGCLDNPVVVDMAPPIGYQLETERCFG